MAARDDSVHKEKTKDLIRGTQLVNLLTQYAETGEYNGKPVDANRIAAARAALPFIRPALQSVEQTQVNDFDNMSEDEMLGLVNALITSNPGLIQKLGIGLRPVDNTPETGIPTPLDTKDRA